MGRLLTVSGGMSLTKPLNALSADFDAGLTKQLIGEQASAHADLAMDTPDRQFDAFGIERVLPGQDMLIDAVNQRAVEIKQEDGLDAHIGALSARSRDIRLAAPDGLAHLESLELRVPEIERLVVASLVMRRAERL